MRNSPIVTTYITLESLYWSFVVVVLGLLLYCASVLVGCVDRLTHQKSCTNQPRTDKERDPRPTHLMLGVGRRRVHARSGALVHVAPHHMHVGGEPVLHGRARVISSGWWKRRVRTFVCMYACGLLENDTGGLFEPTPIPPYTNTQTRQSTPPRPY